MENIDFKKELSTLLEVGINILNQDFEFSSSGYWDSLSQVSVLALVKEHYGITITSEELFKCDRLKNLYSLIAIKLI